MDVSVDELVGTLNLIAGSVGLTSATSSASDGPAAGAVLGERGSIYSNLDVGRCVCSVNSSNNGSDRAFISAARQRQPQLLQPTTPCSTYLTQ